MRLTKENILAFKCPKPIKIRTHRHNTLYLERPGFEEVEAIRTALIETESRTAIARVLHNFLIRPEISLDIVCGWPNRLLLRVGKIWVREALCDETPCETLNAVRSRLDAYVEKNDHVFRRIDSIFGSLTGIKSLVDGAFVPSALTDLLRPFRALESANLLSNKMFPATSLMHSIISPMHQYGHLMDSINRNIVGLATLHSSHAERAQKSLRTDLFASLAAQRTCTEQMLRGISGDLLAPQAIPRAYAERMWKGIGSDLLASQALQSPYADRILEQMRADQNCYAAKMAQQILGFSRTWVPETTHLTAALRAMELPQFSGLNLATLFSPAYKSWEQLQRTWQEAEEGQKALHASGFAFLIHIMGTPLVAAVGRMSLATRDVNITRKMVEVTSSLEFQGKVETLIENTPALQNLWKTIRSAFRAHRETDYELSIPALLLAVEGLFNQLLYARGKAIPYQGKPYMGNPDGSFQQTQAGKYKPFIGLDNKMDHCHISENENRDSHLALRDLIDLFSRELLQDRNLILHGNRPDYADPKLSSKLVWAIYVLAFVLALHYEQVEENALIFLQRM